jgi:hypothetical protein
MTIVRAFHRFKVVEHAYGVDQTALKRSVAVGVATAVADAERSVRRPIGTVKTFRTSAPARE